MSQIYKINRVINNEISQVYVFSGDNDVSESDYPEIFSAEELRNINEKNIPVQIINAYIHGDDTIQRIKEKIFKECRNIQNSIPDEMYLFCITQKKVNPFNTFMDLTQDDSIDLTDYRLKQFLLNFVSNKDSIVSKNSALFFGDIMKKDSYSFEDFEQLLINWDREIIFTESIGQKLVIRNNYPFVKNPFNNTIVDTFLKRTIDNIVTTQNSYLLFKYFPIKNNTIYLCLAEDVLNYTISQELDESYFLKLYYPLLHKSVKSRDELVSKKMQMYNTEKTKINKYYKKLNERIDIFYKIYHNNPEPLDFTNIGISYVHLSLRPENTIKLPLEVLFKIIHSTSKIPLIKYNPGPNYENIYRLFTDNNISISGIKVPTLFVLNNNRKSKILNISNILSRKQSVGFYIEHSFKRTTIELYCEFYENGVIEIKFQSEILLEPIDIQKIIKESINNTILKTIRNYLKQSGYDYINFTNLTSNEVEINSLTFEASLKNNKTININKYIGCISTLFNVIEGSAKKTTDIIDLMFKRVNVFQVMDSIKAFITIRRQNDDSIQEIRDLLLENFPNEISTPDRATELIAEWLQEVQLKIDTYGDRKTVIDSNPGFKTTITSKVFTEGTYSVFKIENINDINYLRFIPIYINSFFRIILRKGLSADLKKEVDKICKKVLKQQSELDVVKDMHAQTEQTGPIKFGSKVGNILEIEVDTDEDELSIEEDTDTEDDEDEDDMEFGDDELGELPLEDKSKVPSVNTSVQEESPTREENKSKEDSISKEESPLTDLSEIEDDFSDDDDEDDDGMDFGDDALGGGGKNDSDSEDDEMEEDLSNLALSGAKSIFTKRLRDNDPSLFLKKDSPGYKSYSRSCPGQYRRQPVLITDEEKKYIDEKDNELGISSYGESIRYGSGENKYNYICPRFWCIRDNSGKPRSLTLEQINRGECGGWDAVIPEKTKDGKSIKQVPRGKRIVELTDERFHRENSKIPADHPARKIVYRPFYPGFQDPSKHPDGLCIPCCFQSPFKSEPNMGWEENKPIPYMFKKVGSELPPVPLKDDGTLDLQQFNNEEYDKFRQIKPNAGNLLCNEDIEGSKDEQKVERKTKEFEDTPIMSFPLRKNQFGYMNLSLQKFLGFDNRVCYTKNTQTSQDKKLKQQNYCIVRLGITKNKEQSFLELIASVYNNYSGMKVLPNKDIVDLTLVELKQIFLQNLTIEKFVSAQNGILPRLFENSKIEIDIDRYEDNRYLQQLSDVMQIKIAQSYENFKNYINSPKEKIDYKYIWDLVTKSLSDGGVLFEDGFNLLILRNTNDDITDKIELICPTNHYSEEFFNLQKKTLMIYQKGDYYEPLCKVYKKARRFETVKFFSFPRDYSVFRDKSNIMNIITKIKDLMERSCIAKKSLKKYDYKRNISSQKLITLLKEQGYMVISQVINNDNRVIGILCRDMKNNLTNYVPSRPSSISFDLEFIFYQDVIPLDYNETKLFLNTIYASSNNKIPCEIKSKLIDDGMVVGFKTITNQVITIIPVPKIEVEDDITEELTYAGENELTNDDDLLIDNSIDLNRDEMVKKLELENNFYSLFRNTLKIILNQKKTLLMKQEMIKIVESRTITYIEKLQKIISILHRLLDNVIQFIDFQLDDLQDYKDMISCLGLNEGDCNSEKHCSFMRTNTCTLTIPSRNLYSNSDNSLIYFNKLADEIVRYSKIRNYLFTPRQFLSFEYVNYKINDNEIILLEEILLESYLENVKLREDDKYIETTNIYDIVNPVKTINYSSTVKDNIFKPKSETDQFEVEAECKMEGKYTNDFIKSLSNNNTKFQIEQYRGNGICGFQLIQLIIFNFTGNVVSVSDIKTKLIEKYNEIEMPDTNLVFNKQDVSTWSVFSYVNWLNGRRMIAESVISKPESKKNSEIALQIQQETYSLTAVDLFLILKEYQVPSIIRFKGSQSSNLNTSIKILTNVNSSNSQMYIIIINKKVAKINLGLVKMSDIYRIPAEILNPNLLNGEKNINNLIRGSLVFQEKKKAKKKQQDKAAQQKVRKKIKKLNTRRKLSAE